MGSGGCRIETLNFLSPMLIGLSLIATISRGGESYAFYVTSSFLSDS